MASVDIKLGNGPAPSPSTPSSVFFRRGSKTLMMSFPPWCRRFARPISVSSKNRSQIPDGMIWARPRRPSSSCTTNSILRMLATPESTLFAARTFINSPLITPGRKKRCRRAVLMKKSRIIPIAASSNVSWASIKPSMSIRLINLWKPTNAYSLTAPGNPFHFGLAIVSCCARMAFLTCFRNAPYRKSSPNIQSRRRPIAWSTRRSTKGRKIMPRLLSWRCRAGPSQVRHALSVA